MTASALVGMTTLALVVAVAAIAIAVLAWQRALALNQELSALGEDLRGVRAGLTETRSTLQAKVDDLSREARRQSGDLKFTANMTIADAMQMDPRVAGVLAEFQLGGCSDCAVSDVDTLEGACRSYGIDQGALMARLARLVNPAADDLVKPINVAKMRVQI